jgi:hypothetical protein
MLVRRIVRETPALPRQNIYCKAEKQLVNLCRATGGLTMKNMKFAGVAAVAGVMGVAVGSLLAPPQLSVAQNAQLHKDAQPLKDKAPDATIMPYWCLPDQDMPPGPPPGPPPGLQDGHAHGPLLDNMLAQLNLSTEQAKQTESILKDERQQLDVLEKQINQLHQKSRTQLDALLSQKQRSQLENLEQEMLPPGPPPVEHPGAPQDAPADAPFGPIEQ